MDPFTAIQIIFTRWPAVFLCEGAVETGHFLCFILNHIYMIVSSNRITLMLIYMFINKSFLFSRFCSFPYNTVPFTPIGYCPRTSDTAVDKSIHHWCVKCHCPSCWASLRLWTLCWTVSWETCIHSSHSMSTTSLNLQAPCVLYIEQAFRNSPENAFYIFNQQIYYIIWYLLDRASYLLHGAEYFLRS